MKVVILLSRLEELIETLCPDGVDFASIGSLIVRVRDKGKFDSNISTVYSVSNTQGIVNAESYRENVIHSEDTSNYTIIKPGMFAYNPSRLNIGSIAYLSGGDVGLVSPMYVVFKIDESRILKEYLDLNLKSTFVKNRIESYKEEGARFRFDFSRWDWIRIPIPPLEVQSEIVRILGIFAKLKLELKLEHTARKKQYEYYRKEILSFNKDDKKVKRVPLSEITNVIRGEYITKKDTREGNVPVILGGQEPAYYIDKSNHSGEIVMIARSGASAGFVSYWNEPIFVTDGFGYEAKQGAMIEKYLYYSLKNIESELNSMKRGAGVPHVSVEALGKIQLPVPTLEEQRFIVDTLDKFHLLCNDISEGLPAEIEARQKQYEYYRDKLLTFKELGA